MKDIFGGADQQKKQDAPAMDLMEMERAGGPTDRKEEAESLTDLMSRQLASGLWDDSTKEPQALRQLKATSKVLLTLLRDGVTTAHAIYGGQVRKAVEALVQLAASVGSRDTAAMELALSIAWLVSTGQRTRAIISQAAQGHATLLQRFQDEGALRTEVEQARLAQ
jgi:Ca-activated chloride channel family protein